MQENLEIMNQEVTLFLLPINSVRIKNILGRIVLILPFFYFSNTFGQQKNKGLLISDFEYQKIEKKYFTTRGGERILPNNYSLKRFAPKPLHQLEYATSAAWASSYAALTIIDAQQTARKGKEITEQAFSPLFPYYYAFTKPPKENTAVSIGKVLAALKKYGTPKYTKFPVRWVTHSASNQLRAASNNKISEYARIFDVDESNSKKIKAIKASLADNLPVIIAMHTPKSFNYAKDFWKPRETFSKDLPAKALCIVGYDNTKYGGAFEVMNSMGTEWGNDGFMWIPYDDLITFTRQAFTLYMIPSKNSKNQLSGGIELEIINGGVMGLTQLESGYYKIKNSYPSGTQFKIKIINHSAGFLYVFASDLTEEIYPFFPPSTTSAAFSTEASFYVPDDATPIEIDETIGTDYLCVLFSKEDLDISAIFDSIHTNTGNFKEKVVKSIKDKLVTSDQVLYNPSSADFTVSKSQKSVVYLIIEHAHN